MKIRNLTMKDALERTRDNVTPRAIKAKIVKTDKPSRTIVRTQQNKLLSLKIVSETELFSGQILWLEPCIYQIKKANIVPGFATYKACPIKI